MLNQVPSATETANIASCFSGHYQCSGVNVQARCDAKCRFTYLSVRSPGGTGDSRAFYGSSLKDFLDEIPRGFYAVGDSAYTLSSSLLVPYTGADKKKKDNDAPLISATDQDRASIWIIGKQVESFQAPD